MRIRFLALLLLLAGGGSAAAQARFQWAAPGECPTEHWQLTEMWRLGPESDPLTYGTVAIERDREGRVYLLNAVLGQIQVYDAQGRYLHALMRKGEGPGEVENPLDFCLMADGNICVMEAFPGELIVIDRTGRYVRTVRPQEQADGVDPFSVFRALIHAGSHLLIAESSTPIVGPATMEAVDGVWRLNGELAFAEKILEKRVRYEVTNYRLREADVFRGLWDQVAVGPDGRVLYAPAWNEYRIAVVESSGMLTDLIVGQYTPLERPGAIKRGVREDLEESPIRQGCPPRSVQVEENWPAILSLRVDDDGLIWVLSSRGFRSRDSGAIYSYDVFGPRGDFRRKVVLRGPGWDEYPAVTFLGGDVVALQTQGYDHEEQTGEEGDIIFCTVSGKTVVTPGATSGGP
jgi:hypothetical protein